MTDIQQASEVKYRPKKEVLKSVKSYTLGFTTKMSSAIVRKTMNMIEVFKTDVKKANQARRMVRLLLANNPVCRVNFDLEDCDKVLRIEGNEFCPNRVMELLRLNGHHCEILK